MRAVLLIDFGSTYTKLTAVDLETETLLGTASAYTTIQTDIHDGLDDGMKLLREKIGDISFEKCYACSSAAGASSAGISAGASPRITACTTQRVEWPRPVQVDRVRILS